MNKEPMVTCGGGPTGDPNGELSALPVESLVAMVSQLRGEKAALIDAMRDEIDEGMRLRELGGALPDENITAMTERTIAKNAELEAYTMQQDQRIADLEAKSTRLQGLLDACHKICGELARPSGI